MTLARLNRAAHCDANRLLCSRALSPSAASTADRWRKALLLESDFVEVNHEAVGIVVAARGPTKPADDVRQVFIR